jgi:hypothetical protein
MRNTITLLVDVRTFVRTMYPVSVRLFEIHNLDKQYIEDFIDWTINEMLHDVYMLVIPNQPLSPTFRLMFDEIKNAMRPHFTCALPYSSVSCFQPVSVKTICNGADLFITERKSYA